jgi:hypothetical protein
MSQKISKRPCIVHSWSVSGFIGHERKESQQDISSFTWIAFSCLTIPSLLVLESFLLQVLLQGFPLVVVDDDDALWPEGDFAVIINVYEREENYLTRLSSQRRN